MRLHIPFFFLLSSFGTLLCSATLPGSPIHNRLTSPTSPHVQYSTMREAAHSLLLNTPVLSAEFHSQYHLLEVIGKGTFGYAFKATSTKHDGHVAVKIGIVNPRMKQELIFGETTEMEILQMINSEKVIGTTKLYDHGSCNGFYYIVTEIITRADGLHDFGAYLRRNPINEMEALKFLLQMSTTMAKIHALNIVHNDIKPVNMLVDEHQNLNTIDFGSAMILSKNNPYLYRFHGSVAYASPQAVQNLPKSKNDLKDYLPYDAKKNDVYCMGISFYQMLNGKEFIQQTENPTIDMRNAIVIWKFAHLTELTRHLFSSIIDHSESKRFTMQEVAEVTEYIILVSNHKFDIKVESYNSVRKFLDTIAGKRVRLFASKLKKSATSLEPLELPPHELPHPRYRRPSESDPTQYL